jgi:hypothetical protein
LTKALVQSYFAVGEPEDSTPIRDIAMQIPVTETYKGWTIVVTAEDKMCAHFSFDITAPSGYAQHVSMGGENVERALERAREMIDMERALSEDE